jgi:hypothetical protein
MLKPEMYFMTHFYSGSSRLDVSAGLNLTRGDRRRLMNRCTIAKMAD